MITRGINEEDGPGAGFTFTGNSNHDESDADQRRDEYNNEHYGVPDPDPVSDAGQLYGDAGLTTGDFTPSGGTWTGVTQNHGTPPPDLPINPDYHGFQPIILDLNNNGIEITSVANSTMFVDGGDGFEHRTAWAGVGDGVLFYDPDGTGEITEKRQYVFSEWDPTATNDMEALASVFDTSGNGELSGDELDDFKIMVTNEDGTTSSYTLAERGITAINLHPDATQIELPDGSMITG